MPTLDIQNKDTKKKKQTKRKKVFQRNMLIPLSVTNKLSKEGTARLLLYEMVGRLSQGGNSQAVI